MEVIKILSHLVYVALGVLTLFMVVKNHQKIRNTRIDTVGRKAYRLATVMFAISAITFGYSDLTHVLAASAIILNHMVTYRRCRPETWLGQKLVKLNW